MKKICSNHPKSKSIVFLDFLDVFCAKIKDDFLIPDKKTFNLMN